MPQIIGETNEVVGAKPYAVPGFPTLRDTLAIYGSDAVIAQLAEHERARYASPTGQKTRDSYVALIQTMRQDAPDLSGSDAEDRDLLTVICGPVTACFGFEDAGHLEGE